MTEYRGPGVRGRDEVRRRPLNNQRGGSGTRVLQTSVEKKIFYFDGH